MPGGTRGPWSAATVLVAAVATSALAGPPAASAAPPPPTPATTELAATPPAEAPGIDPVLDAVTVRATPATRRADERLAEAADAQRAAMLRWLAAEQARVGMLAKADTAAKDADAAQRAVDAAAADRQVQARRLLAATALVDRLQVPLDRERARFRSIAADVMVGHTVDVYEVLGSATDFSRSSRRESFRDRAIQVQTARFERRRRPWATAVTARRAQRSRLDRATRTLRRRQGERDRAVDLRDRFGQVLAAIEGRAADARLTLDRATASSAERIIARRQARLESQVEGQDLALVALDAYWRASALAPCPIPWWVVAGVGYVETRHGTAQGSTVAPNGDTSVHIVGIPLDGRPGTIAVGDSDGGVLDGDTVHDRAVGPMQFLPGTWGRWAVDANADGKADPHNLYDAAAAAGRLLCFAGGDLTTPAGQRAGILAYNRSNPYVSRVLAAGGGYRDDLELPDVPAPPPGPRPRPGPAGRPPGPAGSACGPCPRRSR